MIVHPPGHYNSPWTAYASSDVLGSPGAVYDLLVSAAFDHPVDGNKDGPYLTMRSKEGAILFVINIVGNFGTVFLDNGYYNKAIAASPIQALPDYILSGLSWFTIPWLTATTMGLPALALESNTRFPAYPDRMSEADVSAGLGASLRSSHPTWKGRRGGDSAHSLHGSHFSDVITTYCRLLHLYIRSYRTYF